MEKLKRLQKRLTSAGYDAELITVYNVKGTGVDVPALRVNTDYDGAYPTRQTFSDISAIKDIAKKHRVECRGYYTAVFIY